jgi:hypothetical protein
MQNYVPGNPVILSFALQGEDGTVLTPTALRWRVLDEDDTVLQDWTPVAVPDNYQETLELTVLGALNILTPPALRGMRVGELEVTTALGAVIVTAQALLQGTTGLSMGLNTFSTYNQATLVSQDFSSTTLIGWLRSEQRDERERALIEAHRAILQLPLKVCVTDVEGDDPQASQGFPFGGWTSCRTVPLRDIKPGDYTLRVPLVMRKALASAQLVEASQILDADPAMLARRNGIVSMTVGESSQFFGQGKPLDTPVLSKQVLKILSRWLDYSTRIGRA